MSHYVSHLASPLCLTMPHYASLLVPHYASALCLTMPHTVSFQEPLASLNGDMDVDPELYKEALELFDLIDANGNGEISLSEWREFQQTDLASSVEDTTISPAGALAPTRVAPFLTSLSRSHSAHVALSRFLSLHLCVALSPSLSLCSIDACVSICFSICFSGPLCSTVVRYAPFAFLHCPHWCLQHLCKTVSIGLM